MVGYKYMFLSQKNTRYQIFYLIFLKIEEEYFQKYAENLFQMKQSLSASTNFSDFSYVDLKNTLSSYWFLNNLASLLNRVYPKLKMG